MNDVQRRVVCAANRYELEVEREGHKYVTLIGVRHFCPIMRGNFIRVKSEIKRSTEVQGFVDQFGIFMDRFEALDVAKAAGQLNIARPKTSPEDRLFSEDLY